FGQLVFELIEIDDHDVDLRDFHLCQAISILGRWTGENAGEHSRVQCLYSSGENLGEAGHLLNARAFEPMLLQELCGASRRNQPERGEALESSDEAVETGFICDTCQNSSHSRHPLRVTGEPAIVRVIGSSVTVPTGRATSPEALSACRTGSQSPSTMTHIPIP